VNVSELDEAWSQALAEAQQRARAAGRTDVSEYLALRASNDLLRQTSIEWLLTTFTTLAGKANRAGAGVQIEQQDAHRFRFGNATMVGALLVLRGGVRSLTVEAGWPRTPHDGFIRGGGLACANIKHFGRRAANAQLLLVRSSAGVPQWFVKDDAGTRSLFSEGRAREHLSILLG
jgi:hypothetical protein